MGKNESIATSITTGTSMKSLQSIIKEKKQARSKQIDDVNRLTEVYVPQTDFEVYDIVYEGSYIAAGIVDKIALSLNTGRDMEDGELKDFLNKIDILSLAKNVVSYGNVFLEIIRNLEGKIIEINPIITNTILAIKGGGFVQRVGSEIQYFNAFTPFKEREEAIRVWEESEAGQNSLKYNDNAGSCGYNPNLNEVYQIKMADVRQKRYGVSMLDAVLPQILLLKYIDQYYNSYFENGVIQQKIFYTKQKIGQNDKEAFVKWMRQEAKGIKNAHKSFLLETELDSINLTDALDTNSFLEYRRDLQKSIAMRMNIPYDLLDTTSGNKATSLTAIQTFNQYTVKPIQEIILKGIIEIVSDDERWNGEIQTIKMNELSAKDWNIESDTVKNLYEQGLITLNEAREWMNFKPLPGGDELKTPSKATFELGKDDIETIIKMKDLIKSEYEHESHHNH